MTRTLKRWTLTAVFASCAIAISTSYAEDKTSSPILLKATDIHFQAAPGFPKGAQIVIIHGNLTKHEPYTLRFKLPDGFVIPSHWHTTDEEVTVLSGKLNVGMGDKVEKSASTSLTADGYQLVPAYAHHYVWTTGDTIFQVQGMGPRTTTFVHPEEWTALIRKSYSK